MEVLDHRHASASGWHRGFRLKLTRWRGSPAQPSLMMGPRRGGRCKGVIYCIVDERYDSGIRLGVTRS